MLRCPVFWLLFVMFTLMSMSGLMVNSQMRAFAKDFGITSVNAFGMAALPLALTIHRFTNGLTRPVFGQVSDRDLLAVPLTVGRYLRHDSGALVAGR
jgi:hypothetical protein